MAEELLVIQEKMFLTSLEYPKTIIKDHGVAASWDKQLNQVTAIKDVPWHNNVWEIIQLLSI